MITRNDTKGEAIGIAMLLMMGLGILLVGGMMMWMMGSGMMGKMMQDGMMDQNHMKEMMQEMMSGRLPPGIRPEDLPEPDSTGAQLLVRYCTQCHNLPSPAMHTAEDWPRVEARMLARERMMAGMHGMMQMMDIQAPSKEEERTILAYLQQHALRPASPETLGSPDAPGSALFRRTCSQCHALPDPRLHTADEWPGVVDRMRKNMETMGKPVFTNQERDEILSYLKQQAR